MDLGVSVSVKYDFLSVLSHPGFFVSIYCTVLSFIMTSYNIVS